MEDLILGAQELDCFNKFSPLMKREPVSCSANSHFRPILAKDESEIWAVV